MDEIYGRMKQFRGFNEGNNSHVDIVDNHAIFNPNSSFERIGLNLSGHFDVRTNLSFDDAQRTITAVTSGSHFLHGVRRWGIRLARKTDACCGVFQLWTEGHERFNGLRFKIGNSLLSGVDGVMGSSFSFVPQQDSVWTIYLNNIMDSIGNLKCRTAVTFSHETFNN